jgi:hypothetical protein
LGVHSVIARKKMKIRIRIIPFLWVMNTNPETLTYYFKMSKNNWKMIHDMKEQCKLKLEKLRNGTPNLEKNRNKIILRVFLELRLQYKKHTTE